jgi:hypothetical protein
MIINEAELTAKKRKRLDDNSFGLPDERKFPLNDAAHVKSAIAYFRYCPAAKKKALAKRILAAAKKFGVKIDEDSKVYKAAHESSILEDEYIISNPNNDKIITVKNKVLSNFMIITYKNILFIIKKKN